MNAAERLTPLVHALVDQGILGHLDAVRRDGALAGLDSEGSEEDQLAQMMSALGLRLRWVKIGPGQLTSLARPDLPLVGLDLDRGGGWCLVDSASFGRVRIRRYDDDAPRWIRARELDAMKLWAQLEPVLPAAPWSSAGGKELTPTRRVLALVRSESSDVLAVMAYSAAVGILSLAMPLAIQVLINQLAFGVLLQPIVFLGLALAFCLALAAGLNIAKRYLVEIIQRRVFVRAVADLSGRFTRLRIDALDGRFVPELANRFFDVLTVQKATSTMLLDGFTAVLQALVGFAILALYHPALLVFDVLAVSMLALVLWPMGRGAEYTAIKESKAKYAVASWLEEMARHPLVFKLGKGWLGEARADGLTRGYLEYRAQHFAVFFRQFVGMQAAHVILQVVLLVSCGWLVLEGQLTLGQLVAAEFIVASALTGTVKFVDKLETVYDLLAGIDKLGTLLDLPAEMPGGHRRPGRKGGALVELQGVLAQRDGVSWREPVSLTIEAGSSVGIWGVPGTGKSTLAEVIAGVRRATAGKVLRDNVPVERLSADELFDEVALVRAGSVVQGTVSDNLLLGGEVPPDEVRRVLNAVGLAGTIDGLSQGMATPLGASGEPLSDSQVVDLLVARASLAGARLVVIDGLLDGLEPAHRSRLMGVLLALPVTLVVMTEDQGLADGCHQAMKITSEGLQ